MRKPHLTRFWFVVFIAVVPLLARPTIAAPAPLSTPDTIMPGARYLVEFAEPPAAWYTGDLPGLDATAPVVTGEKRLDTTQAAAQAYSTHLAKLRDARLDAMRAVTGADMAPAFVYDLVVNGVALVLTEPQAAVIRSLPGVQRVVREQIKQQTSDRGPQFIGAQSKNANDVRPALFAAALSGAQEVPAVATPASGDATLTYDAVSRQLSYQVGYRDLSSTPTMAHIHAGIRGANGGVNIDLLSAPGARNTAGLFYGSVVLDPATEAELFAVATQSRDTRLYINIHTTANPNGEIRGQLVAQMGEGTLVGVIDSGVNFSHAAFADIGGDGYNHTNPFGAGNYRGVCAPANTRFPCNDKLVGAYTMLGAAELPDPSPLGEPSPHDEDGHGSHTASTAAGNVLTVGGFSGLVGTTLSGVAPHANLIVYDACYTDSANPNGGGCPDSATLAAVEQAVRDGVDVISYSIGGPSTSAWEDITAVGFRGAAAAGLLVSVSAGNSGSSGARTIGSPANAPWVLAVAALSHDARLGAGGAADRIGDFSSRGPDATHADLLAPSLAAPGISIIAADANRVAGSEYHQLSGTSMAAPHVSGAVLLLRQLHPTWSPLEIASALVTTAITSTLTTQQRPGVPATAFDRGGGRIDVRRAARAGLVLDETTARFLAADPERNGDTRNLNLPGLVDGTCAVVCTWTRTLSSTLAVPTTWDIGGRLPGFTLGSSQAVLSLPAFGSATLVFTATQTSAPLDAYVDGALTLTERDGKATAAALPIVVRPRKSNFPEAYVIRTNLASGSAALPESRAIAVGRFTSYVSGLVKGNTRTVSLPEDDDLSAFDDTEVNASGKTVANNVAVVHIPVTIVSGARRLITEVTRSTAQDIDLYVGRDRDNNNKLSSDETVCSSLSSVSIERCNVDNLTPGRYVLMLHNFRTGRTANHDVSFTTAVVSSTSAGNLTVSAPQTIAAGSAFDLRYSWTLPTLAIGDRWYGYIEYATSATSTDRGNIGTTWLDLVGTPVYARRVHLPVIAR